jgi:TPR repeat protein
MSPWSLLRIAPTADRGEIRKAYAARLKEVRPEESPGEFQALRAAYEAAMAWATAQGRRVEDLPELPLRQPEPESIPVDVVKPEGADSSSATVRPLVDEAAKTAGPIQAALVRGDVREAARVLRAAIAAHRLSIAQEIDFADRLAEALLADRTLPGEDWLAIIREFDWYGQTVVGADRHARIRRELASRVDAELWFAELQRTAHGVGFGSPVPAVWAARLMLGRGPLRLARVLRPERNLGQRITQWDAHRRWIGDRFDPTRIEALRALCRRPASQLARFAVSIGIVIAIGLRNVEPTLSGTILGLGSLALLALLLWKHGVKGFFTVWLWQVFRRFLVWLPVVAVIVLFLAILFEPVTGVNGLLRKAEGGDPAAQTELGDAYISGKGIAKDPAAALQWYRRAAAQGHAPAQFALGMLYHQGQGGLPADDALAAKWLLQAEKAYPPSGGVLGYLYETGHGVPQDLSAARRHYQIAAEAGDAYAQSELGLAYALGRGGPVDRGQAFHWYELAARQGNPTAMNGVGLSYVKGWGVAKDEATGFTWIEVAAKAGQPNAMHTLGTLYWTGIGTAVDPRAACLWLRLATRYYPAAEERLPAAKRLLADISTRLSDDDRQAIEQEAAAWKPSPPRVPELPGTRHSEGQPQE